MKHLKKNPLVQRMEDMTFPLQKNKPRPVFVRMGDKIIPYRGKSGNKKGTNIVSNKSPDIDIFVDTNLDSHTYINNKKVTFPLHKEKVIWEGREWLRSINDDMGFTIMSRLEWHVIALGILALAVVASAYILRHGLVCAPASFYGKTVVNCLRK